MKMWTMLTNFFIPQRPAVSIGRDTHVHAPSSARIVALVPTYKPSKLTLDLVTYLIAWNKNLRVVVIDDNSHPAIEYQKIVTDIKHLSTHFPEQIHVIRTPHNLYKPGALNFGLQYVEDKRFDPEVVFTFDDDTMIDQHTIRLMLNRLYSNEHYGAVCSRVRISNKNQNVFTRMQGLEYHGFNLTKIADNGFYQGPLVMQGMLTGFRYGALRSADGFLEGHLIEDYYLTARLKKMGWSVVAEPKAQAWTQVPDRINELWIQRARWVYGGLNVVREFWRCVPSILQDLIGHGLFLLTAAVVILSFVLPYNAMNDRLIQLLLITALAQFFVGYAYNLYAMVDYQDADAWDYLLKVTILPEFVYSICLSLVLLVSYLYFVYSKVMGRCVEKLLWADRVHQVLLPMFRQIGFSETWVRYTAQMPKGGGTNNV